MARSSKGGRGANGSGSIREITITKNGKTYRHWQGRYTLGYDPVTGKQKVGSISGKTQAEVAKKLREITAQIDLKTYTAPSKMTVEEWSTIWLRDYQVDVRPSTAFNYRRALERYIIPALGSMKLDKLTTSAIQSVYNELLNPKNGDQKPLKPKSVRDVHGVFHKMLEQAVLERRICFNPAKACKLPQAKPPDIKPLNEDQVMALLHAIEGHVHEYYYRIALFTGLRESELLGLTWDCIDFKTGVLTVKQQLRKSQEKGGSYYMSPTKNGKPRSITLPQSVVSYFQQQKAHLGALEENAGSLWIKEVTLYSQNDKGNRQYDLVFRNEIGDRLSYRTVYDCFKRIVKSLGFGETRIHDLRHTYAMIALESGDDVKTLQENLGHATPGFTLEKYGHSSERMKKTSAEHMENFIRSINPNEKNES